MLESLFNKVVGLRLATLLKRDSNTAAFLWNFQNVYLRSPVLKNIRDRLLLEGLFRLLFYCESGINQQAVKKILTDVSGASLLLLELVCLRYVLLLYHLRMFRVFMRIFPGITDFCGSCIAEEEINDLEKLLYLCYLVVLLREVTIHI